MCWAGHVFVLDVYTKITVQVQGIIIYDDSNVLSLFINGHNVNIFIKNSNKHYPFMN